MPLHGKPILQHIIEFYLAKRFRDVILCAGFRAEMIRAFVADQGFEAAIDVSDAGEEASILQRLHAVRSQLGERAMVTYGDTFIDIDPQRMLREHERSGAAVTITIADIRSPFGIVGVDADSRVLAFDEKPSLPYYIGHMIMERRVLEELPPALLALPDGEGLVRLFQELIAKGQLRAHKHTGLRITFNTLSEREVAEEEMVKFFTQQDA